MHEQKEKGRKTRNSKKTSSIPRGLADGGPRTRGRSPNASGLASGRTGQTGSGSQGEKDSSASTVEVEWGESDVRYRPILRRCNYFAGDDGSIWFVTKDVARKRKLSVLPNGRTYVIMRVNGKNRLIQVHRLVLEAFVGPCPVGMECCHWDGNPQNNKLENLRWDTHRANMDDQLRHHTRRYGRLNSRSVITSDIAREIAARLRAGVRQCDIAMEFGLNRKTVHNLACGKAWSHMTGFPKTVSPERRGRPRKEEK